MCWLNTDSEHICDVAILGLNDYLPWESAKICFQNQIDFNYLEARHLWEDAKVDENGIHIAGMNYKVLIAEMEPPEKAKAALEKLQQTGRLVYWNANDGQNKLLKALNSLIQKDVSISPKNKNLRSRHVQKDGAHFYILFNEGEEQLEAAIDFNVKGNIFLLDVEMGEKQPLTNNLLKMSPHQIFVAMIEVG